MKIVTGMFLMFNLSFSQMTESKYIQYLEKTYKKFDVTHLKSNELPKAYKLFDTRELDEYNVSHIKNANHISFDDFDMALIENVHKNDTIVVYCSVGYRSSVIAEKLIEKGFKNVFNLYGGIFLWANNGFEIVDKNGKKTKRLHGYNKFWSRYIYNESLKSVY